MSIIRWGILSTANIGVQKVIPAMQKAKGSVVTAIASRNEQQAQKAAASLTIEKAYGRYEALLNDADIDAVYIPLPNQMHVEWTLKAMAAGKHVLCEKPFDSHSEQIRTLLDAQASTQLVVGEAFMIKAATQWQKVLELIRNGELGEIHAVQGSFFYKNLDPNNIRNQADALGGAMMDIGCYPLMVSRMVFNAEPKRVIASMTKSPEFQTDILSSALMEFENGHCTFSVGTQTSAFQRVLILGSEKHLELLIPFNAPTNQKTQIKLHNGNILQDYEKLIELDPMDQYTLQTENFTRAILSGSQPDTGLVESFHQAAAIEALFESAATGMWQIPKTL